MGSSRRMAGIRKGSAAFPPPASVSLWRKLSGEHRFIPWRGNVVRRNQGEAQRDLTATVTVPGAHQSQAGLEAQMSALAVPLAGSEAGWLAGKWGSPAPPVGRHTDTTEGSLSPNTQRCSPPLLPMLPGGAYLPTLGLRPCSALRMVTGRRMNTHPCGAPGNVTMCPQLRAHRKASPTRSLFLPAPTASRGRRCLGTASEELGWQQRAFTLPHLEQTPTAGPPCPQG